MKIEIRKPAIKDLKKIAMDDRDFIHKKILELEKFPDVQNVKKLTEYEPAYRFRAGNFRVLFDVINDKVMIGRVILRKDSYRK